MYKSPIYRPLRNISCFLLGTFITLSFLGKCYEDTSRRDYKNAVVRRIEDLNGNKKINIDKTERDIFFTAANWDTTVSEGDTADLSVQGMAVCPGGLLYGLGIDDHE